MNIEQLKEIKLKTIFYECELEDIQDIAKRKYLKVEDYIAKCVIEDLEKEQP